MGWEGSADQIPMHQRMASHSYTHGQQSLDLFVFKIEELEKGDEGHHDHISLYTDRKFSRLKELFMDLHVKGLNMLKETLKYKVKSTIIKHILCTVPRRQRSL